jgi:phytoene dehydrogenase-like protein
MMETPVNHSYDVVVIGAGHNGLVASAYLARAGQRVLVLEQRQALGGAASTMEVFPGFRVNTGCVDAGLFLPEIVADLSLESHGLRWLESPAVVFAPQPDGKSLTLWRDPRRAILEIATFSKVDARRYPDFLQFITRLTDVLRRVLTVSPPSLPEVQVGELLSWLPIALKLKSLGRQEMMDALRVLPMSAADFLDEWFESDALKAALASSAAIGNFLGPRSPGTAFMLLYQALQAGQAGFRSSRFVQGGIGRLSEALAEAARLYGTEICLGVGVSRITLEDNRATGVILEGGEHIAAQTVVSNADPQRTFFGLVGASHLDVSFVRDVKNIRMQSSLARLNLALSGLPRFSGTSHAGPEGSLSGHILICPSLDYQERACDDAKYGHFSSHPMLDITLPTISDPGLAPPGMHLMSIDAYYAPFNLQDSGWVDKKEQLLTVVLQTLGGYSPDIQSLVTDAQVLTPLDFEREYGLTRGDIYHGQMGLDQLLMMRPVAGYGRYQTPVRNLFLCGAGAHPGGGVTGAPGYNAAREILKNARGA